MQNEQMRLQAWVESGQVAVPQLFFKHYKNLSLTDEEVELQSSKIIS